jgi:hypothetical protein
MSAEGRNASRVRQRDKSDGSGSSAVLVCSALGQSAELSSLWG